MRSFPDIAQLQCGVFTSEQARDRGWTRSAVDHAVSTGRAHRLRRGACQVADLAATFDLSSYEQARWLHAGPAIAAVLMTPGALASHSTAAVLRGLPLAFLPRTPCATVVPWHTGAIDAVHVHRCTGTEHALPIGEVSCHSIERTIVDLAREHGELAGVTALDCALHNSWTTLDAMNSELATARRWPAVRAARETVRLADALSESPLESHSRLTIGRNELPGPQTQTVIGNSWGGFVARVDFYWDEFGVVGEADGDVKYSEADSETLLQEKRRQAALERLGLQVVRWGRQDLRVFDVVVDDLRAAFARGAGPASERRRWTVLTPQPNRL